MGLARRRHFATRGRVAARASRTSCSATRSPALGLDGDGPRISGHGALMSALETARSGKLGDIVATIQGEQDEIIRAEMPGVLVVQGGPGTGKTVVALHRAAYLLYTHRFPLEGQGVLVVGPNRLFLGYIEQVLPSLGEAGVELAVLADLIDGVRGAGPRHRAHGPGQGRPAHGQRPAPGRARPRAPAARGPRRRLRPDQPAHDRRARARASWPRPVAGSASTTPAAASSSSELFEALARSGRDELVAGHRARPAAAHPGGARGARAHVAGAHPGPAAPRPVRLGGAAAQRRPAPR